MVVASVVHRLRARNNLGSKPPCVEPDTFLCAHRGDSAPWCIRLIRFLVKHGNTCVNRNGVLPVRLQRLLGVCLCNGVTACGAVPPVPTGASHFSTNVDRAESR